MTSRGSYQVDNYYQAVTLGQGGGHLPPWVKKLSFAVLVQAIIDIVKGDQRNREEAEAWINSDETGYLFDFLTVCFTLGLSPDRVRTVLQQQGKTKVHHSTKKSGALIDLNRHLKEYLRAGAHQVEAEEMAEV